MAKKTSKKTSKTKDTQKTSERASSLLNFFTKNPTGKFILYLLLAIALFFINLLISRDDLGKFTLICGIEILLAILFAWGSFIIQRRRDREDK